MAGRDTSPIGRVSGSGLSRAWVVFEPPPLPATERVGPGIGIRVRTECLLSCDALTPVLRKVLEQIIKGFTAAITKKTHFLAKKTHFLA